MMSVIGYQHIIIVPRFRVIHERNFAMSMGVSFFAQCPWPRPDITNEMFDVELSKKPIILLKKPITSRQGRPFHCSEQWAFQNGV